MTLQQAFELASSEERAGRLESAQAIYDQLLRYQPAHVETLMAAAKLNHQMGRPEHALEYMRRAAAAAPDRADIVSNLGMVLAMMQRLDEALPTLQRAIALNPNLAETHNNLGNVLRGKNDNAGAVQAYQAALQLMPGYADAHTNLGMALAAEGDHQGAIASLQRALQLTPASVDAMMAMADAMRHCGRAQEGVPLLRTATSLRENDPNIPALFGQVLAAAGDLRGAIEQYQRAVAMNPNNAETFSYMSVAMAFVGDFDASLKAAERSIQLKPDSGEIQNNWGHILEKVGRFDEAIVAYRAALRLAPEYIEPQNNIASTLWNAARFDEALVEIHKARALNPNFAMVNANLGMMQLSLGDFEKGWRSYEARRDVIPGELDKQTSKPRWDGSDLSGKTIVIESEQGFGDTIQFARYIPMLAARGARVIAHTHQPLARLMKAVEGVADISISDAVFPPFDVFTRMLSLPGFFTHDIATIPAKVPYVSADADRIAYFRDRLAAEPAGLKVGLAWAGNPGHGNDRDRSIKLHALTPLADVPGVQFFSLQKGDARLQAQVPLGDAKLTDWTDELTDFSETAALVQNLDLVITVDSAVAHLAGAMAAKTWVLVQFIPDWRWLLNRTDSPWYPTMRLFRQTVRGSWKEPIDQMTDALRELADGK